MIELTDMTLLEGKGNYEDISKIMCSSGPNEWMLRTNAFISAPTCAFMYTLHFWHNGEVSIYEAERPVEQGSVDDDIRELSEWCRLNGWKKLTINSRLLIDRKAHDFWHRMFLAGLIESDMLSKKESQEMERLAKAQVREQEDEEKENAS